MANYENNSNTKLSNYGAIPPFNEKEASILAERLALAESHAEAQQVLIAWLETGICNKNNCDIFYSLIEICFTFLQRLKNEEKKYLSDLKKAEENLANEKFSFFNANKIANSFEAMEKQDVWESLTPIQKENIHVIKKDFLDLSQNFVTDSTNNGGEGGSSSFKNGACKNVMLPQSKNIVSEWEEIREKVQVLKEECENEIMKLKTELKKRQLFEREAVADERNQREMRIISELSILLFYSPSALNLDAIFSHFNMTFPFASEEEIEFVLRKYSHIFKEIVSGQEKKWIFIGMDVKNL